MEINGVRSKTKKGKINGILDFRRKQWYLEEGKSQTSQVLKENSDISDFTCYRYQIDQFVQTQVYLTFFNQCFCQAPTQLPTPSPLQPNSISTSSQFNSSKSWVGVMPYIWFSPPPPPPPTSPHYFSKLQNQVN